MNINYYTLCWGDYYLQSFLNISLKSFFQKNQKILIDLDIMFLFIQTRRNQN